MILLTKEVRAYLFLVSLIICGLAGSLITAPKVVNIGISFPVSNIVFSIFTYPIVDCICELWGKPAARQALWLGLFSQTLITVIIQLAIMAPHAEYWHMQAEYQAVLGLGLNVAVASLLAFAISQILDVYIYQSVKDYSNGKMLWLRSNLSIYIGQALDSLIFVNIVFFNSPQKWQILFGSILVKITMSMLMTPIIYLIVNVVNRYLDYKTLAFKGSAQVAASSPV